MSHRPSFMVTVRLTHEAASRRRRAALALLLPVLLASGCSMPSLEGRGKSVALPVDEAARTRLGQALAPRLARHPDESGFRMLEDSRDAFAARVLLARAAERTLDVQYYIWHPDTSGLLLVDALHEAADRGVRVRLLLDDFGTGGLDAELARLDARPEIEVRLWNPFAVRSFKYIGFLTNFSRANRRMHNKSFTADNRASVIGGRNVGDEYFGATTGIAKRDLDVLAGGPIVEAVSTDFDRYWASGSAYPLARVLGTDAVSEAEARGLPERSADPVRERYLAAVRDSDFVDALLAGELELEWARATMVSDDPAKGQGALDGQALLMNQLPAALGRAERELVLVSPYLVPTEAGTQAFVDLAARGVEVSILTNSLEATDSVPVHAGYAKRRRALLDAGVSLYEMKRLAGMPEPSSGVGSAPFASSASSLHAKTFGVDRERVFIGSFNFDPRSMHLNTELGFVIESPPIARELHEVFDGVAEAGGYEVRLDERNELEWVERTADGTIVHSGEPGAGPFKRVILAITSWLPVEWLL